MLELTFDTEELRDLACSATLAVERHGESVALQLRRRLSDLQALPNLKEALDLPGSPKEVTKDSGERVIIFSLGSGIFLKCCSGHTEPKKSLTCHDWSRITRVKIIDIGSN